MDIDKIHVLARGVVINDDKILLCKTLKLVDNFYFLPGGHIEHNEDAKSALIREFTEESGLNFTVKRFLGCLENIFTPDYENQFICHTHEYNLIFEAENADLNTNQDMPQIEECIKLYWIPLNQINDIDLKPVALKTQIKKWLPMNLTNAFQKN